MASTVLTGSRLSISTCTSSVSVAQGFLTIHRSVERGVDSHPRRVTRPHPDRRDHRSGAAQRTAPAPWRSGWVTFAGVPAVVAGGYNALSGIAAISDDDTL